MSKNSNHQRKNCLISALSDINPKGYGKVYYSKKEEFPKVKDRNEYIVKDWIKELSNYNQ